MQRDIRAVKLWQLSFGAFLRINTFIILLGDDVIRGNPWVVQAEMEGCKVWMNFVGTWGIISSRIFLSLSMEGKYAVKLSITELFRISRKWRKRYNGRLWKMQMWSDSIIAVKLWQLSVGAFLHNTVVILLGDVFWGNPCVAPNGKCISWTRCTTKGRWECVYGKICESFALWQIQVAGVAVHCLAYMLHVGAEICENMHYSQKLATAVTILCVSI